MACESSINTFDKRKSDISGSFRRGSYFGINCDKYEKLIETDGSNVYVEIFCNPFNYGVIKRIIFTARLRLG